jgi:hypothetical protein
MLLKLFYVKEDLEQEQRVVSVFERRRVRSRICPLCHLVLANITKIFSSRCLKSQLVESEAKLIGPISQARDLGLTMVAMNDVSGNPYKCRR